MSFWKGVTSGLAVSLAFLTRLPLPSFLFRDPPSPASAAWAFPLVGLVVGLFHLLIAWLANGLILHPIFAAVLIVGGGMLLTGALHEDGLADVADGLGGGKRERKLEIMRDSRLGSFGVLALILSVILKVVVFAEIVKDFQPWQAMVIFLGAGVSSRTFMLLVWGLLPAASTTGLGAEKPRSLTVSIGVLIGGASMLGLSFIGFGLVVCSLFAALIAVLVFAVFARWQFGGVTGDVCGATQMVAEFAFLGSVLSLISTW